MSGSDIRRIDPLAAQAMLERDERACLIDVRSTVEFGYVGHPIGAVHIPWKDFPDWQENPDFVAAVRNAVGAEALDRPVLLICRSGVRSYDAAERLAEHGFGQLYNVEEGFEGDKDANRHRGTVNGWRFHGLPWEQG